MGALPGHLLALPGRREKDDTATVKDSFHSCTA